MAPLSTRPTLRVLLRSSSLPEMASAVVVAVAEELVMPWVLTALIVRTLLPLIATLAIEAAVGVLGKSGDGGVAVEGEGGGVASAVADWPRTTSARAGGAPVEPTMRAPALITVGPV